MVYGSTEPRGDSREGHPLGSLAIDKTLHTFDAFLRLLFNVREGSFFPRVRSRSAWLRVPGLDVQLLLGVGPAITWWAQEPSIGAEIGPEVQVFARNLAGATEFTLHNGPSVAFPEGAIDSADLLVELGGVLAKRGVEPCLRLGFRPRDNQVASAAFSGRGEHYPVETPAGQILVPGAAAYVFV